MAEDSVSDDPDAGLPDQVSEWLADIAAESEYTEEELLSRLLAENGADVPLPEETDERLAAVEAEIEALDERLDEQIQDVRDRVIQVKREADAKAPANHGHEELSALLERLETDIDALGRDYVDVDDALVGFDERLDDLDERVRAGFANYEDVLEYLVETTDDLDRKLETLARAVVDLRERSQRLAAADARRGAAERLRESAAEAGITEADCEDCGGTVPLGLLSTPACPHCGTQFGEVEPKRGFFGSATLRAGSQPALEGAVDEPTGDVEALFGGESTDPPTVEGDPGESVDPAETTSSAARSSTAAEERPPGAESGPRSADDIPTSVGDASDDPVETVTGIGAAYADRLADAGVETVGQLALADPNRLAAVTDLSRDRIDGWIEEARDVVESG